MAARLRYSEFRDRLDIDAFEDAIGFEPLYHRNDNDVGYCVFPHNHKHGDTTGKFGLHREKLIWGCYVCGGGDLVSLVMLLKGWEEPEAAVEWLYQFAKGDTRTDDEFVDFLVKKLVDPTEIETRLPYFNERVLERFDGPIDYFIMERGLSLGTVEKFGLRFSERCFKPAPVKRNRLTGELTKAGRDYEGPAAVWPHYWQGQLVGWQYRWLEPRPNWVKKWTNTSDFPKDETIYNLDAILCARQPVIAVESVATAVFCETYDVPAVAYFGSKPTPLQLRWLRRCHHGIILPRDNDSGKTGEQFEKHQRHAIGYLENFIPVYTCDPVTLKEGADLGDFADTDDPEDNLKEHLDRYTHPIQVASL